MAAAKRWLYVAYVGTAVKVGEVVTGEAATAMRIGEGRGDGRTCSAAGRNCGGMGGRSATLACPSGVMDIGERYAT